MGFRLSKAAFRLRRRSFGSSRLEGQHRPTAPLESLISPSLSARALAKRSDINTAGPVSWVSRCLHAIRNPASDAPEGYLAPSGNRKPARLFETSFARTTSRVVANSSPRRKQERRVLHEGASFAFCAGISRGGPGRAVAACVAVLTAGSPGRPRWPTGWAESLSGSLRRRVPG